MVLATEAYTWEQLAPGDREESFLTEHGGVSVCLLFKSPFIAAPILTEMRPPLAVANYANERNFVGNLFRQRMQSEGRQVMNTWVQFII